MHGSALRFNNTSEADNQNCGSMMHMKKKRISIGRVLHNKAAKRVISGITAAALLLSMTPLQNVKEELDGINLFSLPALPAAAAERQFSYTIDEATGNHIMQIFPSQLVDYSIDYQNFPDYHQEDHILITTTGNEPMQVFNYGFQGIGTVDYAFASSIEIGANNEAITLNLDAPLFNYVYDSVTLNNNGGNFLISRAFDIEQTQISAANEMLPLLAQYVEHKTSGSSATWNISVVSPTEGDNRIIGNFAGFVGELEQDASLTINLTMNKTTDENGVIVDGGDIILNGAADYGVGLLCGSMRSNSTLNFTLSGDRKAGNITATAGHAGGLVGCMESGAELNYTGSNIQNDSADIKSTAEDSYAGGLVGYNEGVR